MSPKHKPLIVKFTSGTITKDGIEKIQLNVGTLVEHENTDDADKINVKVDDITFCGKKFDSNNATQCVVFIWDKKHAKYVPQMADTYTLIPDIYSTLDKSCNSTKTDSTSAVEAFGSTQVKKSSKIRQKQTDISTASANKMKETLPQLISNYQDSINQFIDDQHKNKIDSVILPPRNPNANDVTEIYDINSFLPRKVRKHLIGTIDEYRQWLVDSLRDDPSCLPVFIHQTVRIIPNLDTLEDINFFSLIIYWYYLYEFYNAIKKKSRISYVQKTLEEQISKKVLKHLTREFTSEGGTVNNLLLTKCLCYLTLIALYISNFTLDCMSLIQDLGIPMERLKNILKEIGCDISDTDTSANLTLSNKKRKRKISTNKDFDLNESINASPSSVNRAIVATLSFKKSHDNSINTEKQ